MVADGGLIIVVVPCFLIMAVCAYEVYYLEKGMAERWSRSPEVGPILKPSETLMPSHRAYDNHIECASLEDLGMWT